jgi:DNA polymerase-3 subunit alpha
MGGFPVTKVADIRKIISQKLGEASFNAMKEEFISGASRLHNVPADLADRIWRFLVTSATYSFNIAHCISYGMLAYWCMWLKVHHPQAFYMAALRKSDKEKWPMLIKDAYDNAEKFGRKPLLIMPPDLRYSGATWTVHPKQHAIIAGLEQILGQKTIEKIEKWIGSEDPFNLYYAERVLGDLRTAIAKRRLRLPFKPTHRSDTIPRDADWVEVVWMGIPKFREYKDFIEDERARSGKPIEEIQASMDRPDLVKSCVLKCYDDGDEDVYLRFNRFRFPNFKNQLEGIRLDGSQVVVAKGVKRRSFGLTMQVKHMVVIDVDMDIEDEDGENDGLYAETA